MPYIVDLETFHGPLDLLLYLVKRNEVDLRDIPVAMIAEQYLNYLEILKAIDVEAAGDFLVMAATLMDLKAKHLLHETNPPPDGEPEQEDPRAELVRQLLEYRRVKEAASALERQVEKRQLQFAREITADPNETQRPARVQSVELWDLLNAFARMIREAELLQPKRIIVDDTPQHIYEARLRDMLSSGRAIRLIDLFPDPPTKAQLIGYFLALLQMIRVGELELEQPHLFGEMTLRLRPPRLDELVEAPADTGGAAEP